MATYILLTRLAPESVRSPADLKRLEKGVEQRIRKECPDVRYKKLIPE